jgi:hypothetical protein
MLELSTSRTIMPETKLACHSANKSHPANNRDKYLLCSVPRRTVQYHRHTNHVVATQSQRLASHSNAHRQHEMNEPSQKDNTGAAGAKGEARHRLRRALQTSKQE